MACNCSKQPALPAGPIPSDLQGGVLQVPLDDTNSALYAWRVPVSGMTNYIALSGYRYRVWETGQLVRVANVDVGEFQSRGYI